jgi:hypothetical protein
MQISRYVVLGLLVRTSYPRRYITCTEGEEINSICSVVQYYQIAMPFSGWDLATLFVCPARGKLKN